MKPYTLLLLGLLLASAARRPRGRQRNPGTPAAIPFSSEHPPVTLRVNAQKIDWGLEDGYELVCSKWPQSLTPLAPPEEIELYPYGGAKLRMTELPMKNRQ